MILAFVGSKMLVAEFYHVPVALSLVVIGVALSVSIVGALQFEDP